MKSRFSHIILLSSFFAVLLISGCYQGRPSKREPIHINPNMDSQPKYLPQEESKFFADGATMRPLVDGTVARGELREDSKYYTGKDEKGNYVKDFPEEVTFNMALVERGQHRFNIYCSPCHSRVGNGRGIVVEKGLVPPPSFHTDSLRAFPVGRFFDVITNGIRNMPPYKYQIPVADRWAIISYVKALQRSHEGTIKDVPESLRGKL